MIIVTCLILLSFLTSLHAQENASKQKALSFEKDIKLTVNLQYLLYLPLDYENSDSLFPLLLFLHGAGERGDDINLVKKNGPPKLIEEGKDFPFIVVSPQCPTPDGMFSIFQHYLMKSKTTIALIKTEFM